MKRREIVIDITKFRFFLIFFRLISFASLYLSFTFPFLFLLPRFFLPPLGCCLPKGQKLLRIRKGGASILCCGAGKDRSSSEVKVGFASKKQGKGSCFASAGLPCEARHRCFCFARQRRKSRRERKRFAGKQRSKRRRKKLFIVQFLKKMASIF